MTRNSAAFSWNRGVSWIFRSLISLWFAAIHSKSSSAVMAFPSKAKRYARKVVPIHWTALFNEETSCIDILQTNNHYGNLWKLLRIRLRAVHPNLPVLASHSCQESFFPPSTLALETHPSWSAVSILKDFVKIREVWIMPGRTPAVECQASQFRFPSTHWVAHPQRGVTALVTLQMLPHVTSCDHWDHIKVSCALWVTVM